MSRVFAFLFLLLLAWSPALAQVPASGQTLDLLIQGSELHYQGRLDQAREILSMALEREPDNVFAMNQLALVLSKLGKSGDAELLFARSLELDPENIFAMTWLAIHALGRNDADTARQMLEGVFALDPDNGEAHYLEGVILGVEGDARASLESFIRAQEADSQDPDVHYHLALAFQDLGLELNARLELERTLALDPGHVRAMDRLGWLYYNGGYGEQALELWRRALELGYESARGNLAKAHLDSVRMALDAGRTDEAIRLCRLIQALDPGNKAATFFLEELEP